MDQWLKLKTKNPPFNRRADAVPAWLLFRESHIRFRVHLAREGQVGMGVGPIPNVHKSYCMSMAPRTKDFAMDQLPSPLARSGTQELPEALIILRLAAGARLRCVHRVMFSWADRMDRLIQSRRSGTP